MEVHYTSEHQEKPKQKSAAAVENPEASTFAKAHTSNRHQPANASAPGKQIKYVDLLEIIEDIFSEEYDS